MNNRNGQPLGADLTRPTGLDDLIVITGAGGFIAGNLTRYFHDLGYRRIRAIDRKPLPEWYQHVAGVESLSMDLSKEANAIRAVEGATEVYNLAAVFQAQSIDCGDLEDPSDRLAHRRNRPISGVD